MVTAHLTEPLFWGSLLAALVIAALVAFTVVRWLIRRGRGHAVVREFHARTVTGGAAETAAGAQHAHRHH